MTRSAKPTTASFVELLDLRLHAGQREVLLDLVELLAMGIVRELATTELLDEE